ncbi:hypothetical protein [Hymenobacter jeollabukensis]|uniref:Lipoprotein n=1 Tax=Hymenobacter jeollabukensis TaxID=2025313 RepID=A0A5R8WLJ6_9BACT|nr:hypothetical protein [Hymenobacter jeollabukensis]TLM90050.1 hypothetical protein FDY95_18695 [Hymenobacter jeollabukensis]
MPKPVASPPAADSMRAMAPFVPRGYRVLYTRAGDLNRDAWPDRVVVLDTAAVITDSTDYEEQDRIQRINRPLLLLLGQPGGRGYTLAARNDHVVFCADCSGAMGGDPFQQVVIRRGYFSVEHYGGSAWRWVSIVTFRYNPADRHWYLHRSGRYGFHAANPDSTIENEPRTTRDFGRVRFEAYQGGE